MNLLGKPVQISDDEISLSRVESADQSDQSPIHSFSIENIPPAQNVSSSLILTSFLQNDSARFREADLVLERDKSI